MAPQNISVPGVVELAEHERIFIGGDDLRTGRTKLESDYLRRHQY